MVIFLPLLPQAEGGIRGGGGKPKLLRQIAYGPLGFWGSRRGGHGDHARYLFGSSLKTHPVRPTGGKVPPVAVYPARADKGPGPSPGPGTVSEGIRSRGRTRCRGAEEDLCLNIATSRSHRGCTVQIQASPNRPSPRADPPTDRMKQNATPDPAPVPFIPQPTAYCLAERLCEAHLMLWAPLR